MDNALEIQNHWIDAFQHVFELCKISKDETAIVLCETGSRQLNVQLSELALARMGVQFFRLTVPSPAPMGGPIVRSSGMSLCLGGQAHAVSALSGCDIVIDLTIEGLMHARETGQILKSGARIMNVSNEHPEILSRLLPDLATKEAVKDAVKKCKLAKQMSVNSDVGTDLIVSMPGASHAGVWGFTDRPGTLAHWPAGIIVSFPVKGSTNGRLVFQSGDMNLTFKRYFESEVIFNLENDYVTSIEGNGVDARLMRQYLDGFGDPEAYATSHVGWGLSKAARYEALLMYDKSELNCTELRAVAGNFLYSTGANEFAGRFTHGHFDLPMMGCTIALDGENVVSQGVLV